MVRDIGAGDLDCANSIDICSIFTEKGQMYLVPLMHLPTILIGLQPCVMRTVSLPDLTNITLCIQIVYPAGSTKSL